MADFEISTETTVQLIPQLGHCLGSRRNSHFAPVFQEFHLLPVPSCAQFKVLVISFKALYGQEPVYCPLCHVIPAQPLKASDEYLLQELS